jgi:DNA sulfur modification protein DndB
VSPLAEPPPGELIRDHLIPAKKINGEARKRLSENLIESIKHAQIPDYEADGWVLEDRLKFKAKMRRPKPHDIAFEDRVWATFAHLQFTHLNADRGFKLRYGSAENQQQQIDVFAADDDVVLVIECKSTATIRPGQFKKEIEAFSGQRGGIIRRLQKEYPDRKVKFVLATNNYTVSKEVAARMEEAQIFHMTEDTVEYYLGLADHLGAAAKFQLLGALFAGMDIPNMDATVPAIRGSMGGYRYYSFMIEPERLLKMSYVLHRNQANSALMPTYQRLIKKSRLKKVAHFVDEEQGFFPNSIIVNVESKRPDLRFDLAPATDTTTKSRIGLLHLPQTYRAAYIIDGQHRLYGYAESQRAATDLIPVVAFVNMPRPKQVEMFMQINENQAAVPKNLRNTLNSDLLWDSGDLDQRAKALRLRVAQHLGEQKTSPLFDRVIIGENTKSDLRCITIDAIANGLYRGNFLGRYTKIAAKSLGTFHAGENQATFDALVPFLEQALGYLSAELFAQFSLGGADGGFVFMNNGIEALLRLLSDVTDHLIERGEVSPPLTNDASDLLDSCKYYLDPLIEYLNGLTAEEALGYRRMYGSGAGTTYHRRLQAALREARPEFSPSGLDEWLAAQDKKFNLDATDIVRDLETSMKGDIRQRLEHEFGADRWERDGIPRKVRERTVHLAADINLDRDDGIEVAPWDCMYLIDCREVLMYSEDLWKRLFEKRYTRPGDEPKNGKKNRTEWLVELNGIRNNLAHDRGVSEDEFTFLVELRSWLLRDEIDNDL